MAQAGFTPIKIYSSSTATNVPLAANLAQGELAINTADGKLFYEDSSGVVQVIGWKTVPISAGGTGATTAPQANANLQTFTTTATAVGTTTLTNASTYYQYFTGSTTQTIVLPVVSTLSLGWSFHIANNSTGNLTLNSSGGNLVATILPGTTVHVTCILITGTTAASWDYGVTDFGSVTGTGSVVLSASPTFTGVPLAPTAAVGTDTTQIATTEFVINEIGAIAAGVTSFSGGTTGLLPSSATSGAITLTGTLNVANGGTGITSLGTGVATWLGTPSSANLRATITDETGTGVLVFSTNPTFASLTNSGNITFTGTVNRISGDFSNATYSNRVLFQSSTVNGFTGLGTIPNGSSVQSGYVAYGASDPDNCTFANFYTNGTSTLIVADKVGTGSYGPISLVTSTFERLTITTAGGVAFGGPSNYGTAGQVLQSNGNAPPTWTSSTITPTSGTAPYFGARGFASFSMATLADISATYTQNNGSGGAGTIVTLTVTSHNYQVGHYIYVDIATGGGVDGLYVVTAVTATTIRYTAATNLLIVTGTALVKQCTLYAGSQNVANVVYPGTGAFVVNFTTAMPFANYVATASAGTNNTGAMQAGDDNYIAFNQGSNTGLRTTQSIRGFSFQPTTQGLENSSLISIVVFA